MLNKTEGVKAIKHHADEFTGPGNPDIIGTWWGISFVIEMKKDEYTDPDPLQLYELEQWSKAGAIAFVGWDPYQTLGELRVRILRYQAGEFTPFERM